MLLDPCRTAAAAGMEPLHHERPTDRRFLDVKPVDIELMQLMDEAAVSYQAVLTKADKVKPQHLPEVIAATHTELARHPAAFARLLATSAEIGTGISELRAEIAALAAAHGAFNGVQTPRP